MKFRIKIPSVGWGGWRGNPGKPSSTSFRESVVEPTRAGDLTYPNDLRNYSCATVPDLHRLRR